MEQATLKFKGSQLDAFNPEAIVFWYLYSNFAIF